MKYRKNLTVFCTLFLFTIATAPGQAAEQGDEFRLNVYGMYCNQCAYGLEQELKRTGGVTDAIVDLQNNSAVVKVEPSAPPAAEALVQAALDQGLSVKEIAATLTGLVEQSAIGWELVCGSQRFNLTVEDAGLDLGTLGNRPVTLEGVFAGIKGVDSATGKSHFIASSMER